MKENREIGQTVSMFGEEPVSAVKTAEETEPEWEIRNSKSCGVPGYAFPDIGKSKKAREPRPTVPYMEKGGRLVISFDSHPRYHWWKDGQSIEETIKEITMKTNNDKMILSKKKEVRSR